MTCTCNTYNYTGQCEHTKMTTKQALQLQNEGEKSIVVGHHLKKSAAIDFTPIHQFVVTTTMQPGDMFEWDEGTSHLLYKGNNTNHA